MKNHERKNRRFNNWFSSTFYSIFVKNFEKFEFSPYLCGIKDLSIIGLFTGKTITSASRDFSLWRHYRMFRFRFRIPTPNNQMVVNKLSYELQTRLFSGKNLILNKKSKILGHFWPKMTKLHRNCMVSRIIWSFVLKIHDFCCEIFGGNFYLNWIFVW